MGSAGPCPASAAADHTRRPPGAPFSLAVADQAPQMKASPTAAPLPLGSGRAPALMIDCQPRAATPMAALVR